MMGIDEQRGAAAMSSEDFQQAAVLRLRQAAPAARLGQAGAEHSEPAQTIDHPAGDFGVAIDRGGIHLSGAKGLQFGDHAASLFVHTGRIWRKTVAEMSSKVQSRGESKWSATLPE